MSSSFRSRKPVAADPDTGIAATLLPPFLSVNEIVSAAGLAVERALPDELWIKGEVVGYKGLRGESRFFQLVERDVDHRDVVLPAVIWGQLWPLVQQKLLAAGMTLKDGQEMLFRGRVRVYKGSGALSLHIKDVLPEFTLGQIELQKRKLLERLVREGLCDRNKQCPMPEIPLRIGLVSSLTALARDDFLFALGQSGYAFQVYQINVPVQGREMEGAVCQALRLLAEHNGRLQLDVVCIVRGGGSAIDLGWWNNYPIAVAVAEMPIRVVCAIGHNQDRVAIDGVAHTCSSTPTAAAKLLVGAIQAAEATVVDARRCFIDSVSSLLADQHRSIETCRTSITELAQDRCSRASELLHNSVEQFRLHALHACRREAEQLETAKTDLSHHSLLASRCAGQDLHDATRQLEQAAQFQLRTTRKDHQALRVAFAEMSSRALAQEETSVQQLRLMIEACDPAVILQRGYSITFDSSGKALKEATSLAPGSTIITRLARGQVRSTVNETSNEK